MKYSKECSKIIEQALKWTIEYHGLHLFQIHTIENVRLAIVDRTKNNLQQAGDQGYIKTLK